MTKQNKNNLMEDCRKTMQALRENSYFDRFREPDEEIHGQTEEPEANYSAEPEMPQNEPEPAMEPNTGEEPKENVLSSIRKAIINGLAEYADNIEDPTYQILKKLFAIIDKRDEDNSAERMNNNQ